jgi:hypothetical protein
MGAASAEAESRSSSADRAPTPDNPAAWEPLVFQQTGLPCPATGGIGTARFSADRAPTPGDRRHRNRSSSAGRAPTPGNLAAWEPLLFSRPGSHARQPGDRGTAPPQQAGLPRPATWRRGNRSFPSRPGSHARQPGGVGTARFPAGRAPTPGDRRRGSRLC